MNRQQLFRLPDGTVAYLEMHSVAQILKDKGLDPAGDAQAFHTRNVLRRIVKYMPFRSGMTIKVTVAQTDPRKPEIVTNTPYARFLFHGRLMVGDETGSPWARRGETKHVVDKALSFDRTKNPKAGPRWDRAVSAAEGRAMAADLQRYLNRKR